jgi:photosystem II stability/assembly factor-like uncharacterized protein
VLLSVAFLLSAAAVSAAPRLLPAPEHGYGFAYGPWRSSRIGGGGYVLNVVPAPGRPGTLYAHSDVGGLYRSDDDGRKWRMLHGNMPTLGKAVYQVRALAVHPRDADTVLIGTGTRVRGIEGGGVWKTTDGGASWRRVLEVPFDGNAPNRKGGQTLQFAPSDPDRAWAGTAGGGLWRSDDAGETWRQTIWSPHDFSHVLVDRANPDRIWAGATGAMIHRSGRPVRADWFEIMDPGAGLWRTEDGGTVWEVMYEDRSCIELVQDPVDPDVLYEVRLDLGVWRSRDAGQTWEEWNDGLPLAPGEREGYYNAIGAGPDFIVVANWDGLLYRRRPADPAWTAMPFRREHSPEHWFGHGRWHRGCGSASVTVDPHDPSVLWETDAYGLWRVTNDGADWTYGMTGLEDTVIHTILPDPVDPMVVHLGMGDNGYFVSRDGGQSFRWTERTVGNIKALALCRAEPSVLYATGSMSWAARDVFGSRDGGRTWQELPAEGLPERGGRALNSIAVDPQDPSLVYLAAFAPGDGGGIYRSRDGGATWAKASGEIPAEYRIKDNVFQVSHTLAIGADRNVYASFESWEGPPGLWRSTDLSETWRQCTLPGAPWIGRSGAIAAHPSQPGVLLLAKQDGLWRTADRGDTWRRVYGEEAIHPSFAPRPPYLAVCTTDHGPIASEDGGLTWAVLDRRLPDKVWGRACCTGDRILVGASSGVFWAPLTENGRRLVEWED